MTIIEYMKRKDCKKFDLLCNKLITSGKLPDQELNQFKQLLTNYLMNIIDTKWEQI